MPESITIVGSSLAGLRGAEALRKADFGGRIRMIGAEAHLPYDRPPLSKQVLAGTWEPERIALADSEKLAALDLQFVPSTKAIDFDLGSRQLVTEGPQGTTTEAVDSMLIATGARARWLPGTEDMAGVYTLRTIDDSLSLMAGLEAAPSRVVVIGAGFIGAEVAATVKERGIDVTLIESMAYPMARALDESVGTLCGEVLVEHGIDLRLGVGVASIEGDARVERVVLSDGSTIDAEIVVVGIGVLPNTEWLATSGLEIDNGVVCDATCLAAPGITAAGDVARWPNTRFDEVMRVEHWENAVDQAGVAARRLLLEADDAPEYRPVPWFWSDQFDRKIQMAGRPRATDETCLVTGSLEERRFAVIYGRDNKLTGVFGMNRPRHVMQYRMRIDEGMSWQEAVETADS